jgi:flagellin
MPLVINTNLAAQSTTNNLNVNQGQLQKSLARLSSGSRITSISDDASGTAVSMKMSAQIQRHDAVKGNVANATSFTQVQDGYMQNIATALERMGELSLLALDTTRQTNDLGLYDQEYQQLKTHVDGMIDKQFNGVDLFAAVGENMDVTVNSDGATMTMLAIDLAANIKTPIAADNLLTVDTAKVALANIDFVTQNLATSRAQVGAYQSRLNAISDQISIGSENLTAARSRIQDVDVAKESSEFARYNILVQSGTAMLAQANQLPQNVLRLLQ